MKRRKFVEAAGVTVVGVGLIGPRSALAAVRQPTPTQAEGPFYPVDPIPLRSDLVHRIPGQVAQGTLLELSGRVVGVDGTPIPNARIEIWQCDHTGHYRHPRDYAPERQDAGFHGYGAQITDAAGAYRFLTIVPVPYASRPPHIHVKVHHPGGVLTTQLYLEGRAEEKGFMARMIGGDRDRLLIDPVPNERGRSAQFEFVV